MNPVIINLATGHHLKGQERLRQSAQRHSPKIPIMTWQNEFQLNGCPRHTANPYAFKVFAFYKALAAGYDTIFWMDASCYLIKDVMPIFEIINNEGYFLHEAGHYAGTWTNDFTLDYFKINRDVAMTIPVFTAGCFGLSMLNHTAVTFLDNWRKSMDAGCFKGQWNNNTKSESQDERCKGHRHDLSCGSIIANQLSMSLKFGNNYLEYKSPQTPPKDGTIFIGLQGI